MASYAAFLRGIMPMNPNMRNERLRGVFEELGFADVKTVISSGNLVFSTKAQSAGSLEEKIEKAIETRLGFKSATFVRTKEELEALVVADPFKGKAHGRESYLIVTFLKKEPRQIFNALDLTRSKTPDFMAKVEKEYGKGVTTRTWKTVERVLAKFPQNA